MDGGANRDPPPQRLRNHRHLAAHNGPRIEEEVQ